MIGNDDLTLVVYTADRGSPSDDQLKLLTNWAEADHHERELSADAIRKHTDR